ncbi:tRNA (uracil-5-)-methyltransferase homolog A-like [Diadema setosum]|uniref:tRNA (uracil-5-)-methyltransferase homolog A-like n=1 Tax=Diadema setosum TaxID=31175 RepID=UPI003B39FA9E
MGLCESDSAPSAQDSKDAGGASESMRCHGDGQQDSRDAEMEDAAGGDEKQNSASGEKMDLFHYTRGDEFTSEIFKIVLKNLPSCFGYKQLRKMLEGLDLKPKKIKSGGRSNYAFITFTCEDDRQKALQLLNGHKWKGRNLMAKNARPLEDPMLASKRKRGDGDGDGDGRGKKARREDVQPAEDADLTVEERLNFAVTPLWKMAYDEQLELKQKKKRELLRKFTDSLEHSIPDQRDWIKEQKKKNEGLCCLLEKVRPSPVTTGYRNKCEFSIGTSPGGEEKTVGFRLGLYKGGQISVVNPSSCLNVPERSKAVVQAFQSYIRHSNLAAYDPVTHKGHWRMLTVRTTQGAGLMVMVTFHRQTLSEEEVEKEKGGLAAFFRDGDGRACGVTSLHIHVQWQGDKNAIHFENISGEKHITEDLLGLKFRISPQAFFQVNTLGAEILYTLIADWAQVDGNTTLLDICCGTGTIGISLAKKVEKVIGVEMNQQAVDDAKENAAINGVSNVTFYCGKAEDLLPDITTQLHRCLDVVGIVDPPRAGLHPRVLQAVRRCPHLNRLVYVSCDAGQALQNFINLCRPVSKKMKGMPFKLVKAIPVDLFPHASHCELVLLFERNLRGDGQGRSGTQSEPPPAASPPPSSSSASSETT